ncbi:endoribonuclease L-PSP [Colletotrichum karsti]|uniref:Endoribonuclease L-PSP n=1 Tax=Colletotrichum karsti TaxID=1095194 RepID=A0A9P6LHD1_9PEZI|nr:endoribonuclease L-PSP [Colletotrichum karsti]KAF9873448.1 endoribonuclease L-PSP [Colletotrichum karsti]
MKILKATMTLLFAFTAASPETPQPNELTLEPNYTSPLGVQYINPSTSYDVTGPFSLLSIAGSTLYVAGVRGIHPSNNSLAEVGYPRIRLAYENMAALARSAGSDLTSCVRLVVYVSDMYRYRPIVNRVQQELWGEMNSTGEVMFPPSTIVEMQRLNDDDIVEVEGTFWLG